jgi:hypothetical protein
VNRGERRALDLARDNYRHFPHVRGVGFGSKFTDGARVADVQSVQFFVTRKIADEDLARSLPRFVYARRPDGTLDRDRTIPTDVIEIGDLELCCAAGDRLDRVGASGSAALIFKNKTADGRLLVITCSHVVGDLSRSPQQAQLVGGSQACQFQASIVANTVVQQGRLEFDVALGDIFAHDSNLTELTVSGTQIVLDGFADEAALAPPSDLFCVSPESGHRAVHVESMPTEFREIDAGDGTRVAIGNLIACKADAVKGDSGGIVFAGSKAAGIVVARGGNGWLLMHPLEDAIGHLATIADMQLRCFGQA